MKLFLVILATSVIGCSHKNSIQISNAVNNFAVQTQPFSKDSLRLFLPYSFQIKNNSVKTYRFKSTFSGNRLSSDTYLIFDINKEHIGSKSIYLRPFSTSLYHMYLEKIISKKEIDSSFWKTGETYSNAELRKLALDAGFRETPGFKKLLEIMQKDSIAFRFISEEFNIIMSTRLGEEKFNFITSDEILANPKLAKESIYKPQ